MAKLKAHPYADLFPMMSYGELEALTADIAEFGLRQPIVLYQGEILDGRNRSIACERAGVDPSFITYEGDDPLGFVLSLNVQRRDMTAAQRAIVAARVLEKFPERRGRPEKSGRSVHNNGHKSRDSVAAMFKVGVHSIQQAKAILGEAPDLVEQVESKTRSLADAFEDLQTRRKEAQQRAADARRIAEYTDAISSGEMTLEEALQKAMAAEREEQEELKSEIDARRTWLNGFAEALGWLERYAYSDSEEYWSWNFKPDSPGWFDHGITADRLERAEAQLRRMREVVFTRSHS